MRMIAEEYGVLKIVHDRQLLVNIEQARKAAFEYLSAKLDPEYFGDKKWPGPVYRTSEEYLLFIVCWEANGVGATHCIGVPKGPDLPIMEAMIGE